MDVFWIRVVSQLGVYITFVAYLLWTGRQGRRAWIPFLGTVLYALVFEHFNMLRYAHSRGGYHYHPLSWLFVLGDVPLYIPLAWAFIVATSRSLSDHLVRTGWRKPFCDALLALLIDVSLDVVAIRLRFWFWHGVGQNDGFFGVPADNFLGWLLVTFTFCALTRWLWSGARLPARPLSRQLLTQWILVPLVAYAAYLGIEAVVHLGYVLCHATTLHAQFYVLTGVLVVFLLAALPIGERVESEPEGGIVATGDGRWHTVALHGPRQIFHLFGILGLTCVPFALRSPALWVVTFVVWTLEGVLAWRVHVVSRGLPRL